ncbi:protein Shroom1 isoform X1 [Rhinatrema bivittatum]|uniref:protein Shroom1 isoform X1 n=1 Tax=Rhinatrema bivittatum TaxID=194408 RepID=UPI00112B3115|nr:protein Shroom1 isoform X1 [Rhinatrema bivittatum]XP_029439269.1 protein Shroom1 isoform X1 [Rhinatrema bivittatum]XP_029439270.1 protein Shroom1 isoform X1 [Rhinatrema bivittatum]XP_029439271.1 protein Shroom1 isoform X1 [Rhinatrema bivittatum]XP_029439272.1 protein Shroom1 isoform X1 [Rhinatrema bivittatum]XP_029439273.1 protein Shroom1 isoform X1 [Rhinatrema bivittatum]XP_029439274.1 protein Shroom1 isoform X1 [Rhinatrema bivittatum]XP_029439275.1 protein Shroom1 isoform X1 [Rhinatrema
MRENVVCGATREGRREAPLTSEILDAACLAMASFGSKVERWSLKDVGGVAELLHPLGSVHYGNRLSPVKSISALDQLLNLPGKADSAYSSFCGGSNVPEYHTASFYNENYSLPSEPSSYMDSEYVRAIYNPGAVNSDLRETSQPKPKDVGGRNNFDGASFCGRHGSTPDHDFVHKALPPWPSSQSLLPHPPSPPARLDSYKAIRSFDSTRKGSSPGDLIYQTVAELPHSNNIPGAISASQPKPPGNARQKSERLPDEPKVWDVSQDTEKKGNQHNFTRHSSFILQECFKSDSMAKTQKLLCAPNSVHDYKIPEELNCKSSHPPRTSHDARESKQYLCATETHVQPFRGADPLSILSEGRRTEVPFPNSHSHLGSDRHPTQIEDVTQGIKFTSTSLKNESVSETKTCLPRRKVGIDLQSHSSEEERRRDVQELSLTQRSKTHSSSRPHSPDGVKTGVPNQGEADFRSKAQQIFYCGPKDDVTLRSAGVFRYEMQGNENSRDLNINQKQEVTANPGHYEAAQPEFQKLRSTPVCDLTSDKINKETTPMLYHLAGGRHTNVATILNCKNHTKPPKDPGNEPKKTHKNHSLSSGPITEVEEKTKLFPKNQCFQQLTEENIEKLPDGGRAAGSPGSSLDDSFMKDYREKIKFAQKKVLRETSFKRKDLQMSLPIRLKPNPSKRPSIEHFRSFSANEDIRFIPPSGLLETSSKSEDSKKPQVSRIGGRKRVTKEQKKFCYSEPEKLDQLGMPQTLSSLWNLENTRVATEENNDPGLSASRRKPLENRERARSTSNLSKTELKQIQHNAVVQYIERKTSLRPTITQQIPLSKPMQRPSTARRHSEWICNSSGSRTPPSSEGSSQPQSSGRSPESFSDTPVSWTDRATIGTSLAVSVQSRTQPLVREVDQSNSGLCPSAESLHHSKDFAFSKGRERSKSTPPAQVFSRSTTHTASALNGKDPPTFTCSASNEADSAEVVTSVPAETLRVRTARGRGKSMEESGIPETIPLSVLSQSTDQLHRMKGPGMLPGPGHELGAKKGSAVTYQDSLLQSLENALESPPRQMPPGGASELPAGAQVVVPAHESQGVFSRAGGTPSSPSAELPPTCQPRPTPPASLVEQEGDLMSGEDAAYSASTMGEEAACPPTPPSAPPVAPEAEQRASLHDPAKGEASLGNGELPALPSSSSVPGKHLTFQPSRKEDRKDRHALMSKNVIGNPQELVGVNVTLSLDNITNCPMALGQSDQDKDEINCESLRDKLEESRENPTGTPRAKLKSPEDRRSEELASEILASDKSLVDVLEAYPIGRTALELLEGLFPVDLSVMDRSSRMGASRTGGSVQAARGNDKAGPVEASPRAVTLPERCPVLSTCQEGTQEPDDVTVKKMELISHIQSKLQHLSGERELLLSDIQENASRGEELEAVVKAVCKPNEYERYRMFIGDLEKVVILLLSLSMRLARVQNAMSKLNDAADAEERQSLDERHKLLTRQRDDAKDLKENLDRRERAVSGILAGYLSKRQLQDYGHFVKLKTSFLIEQKDLEERIKFHEEQLESLQKSIPLPFLGRT